MEKEPLERASRKELILITCLVVSLCLLFGLGMYGAAAKKTTLAIIGLCGFVALFVFAFFARFFAKRLSIKKAEQDPDAKETQAKVVAIATVQKAFGIIKNTTTYKVWVDVNGVQSIGYAKNKTLKKGDSIKVMFNPDHPKNCKIL